MFISIIIFLAAAMAGAPESQAVASTPRHVSLWVWGTDHLLENQGERTALLAHCRALGINRLYFYLRSDARFCAEAEWAERLKVFLGESSRAGIEVWGLLGEPEWISKANTEAVTRAVGRILAFNSAQGRGNPRLAGIKFDLEPHTLTGWKAGGASQLELGNNMTGLVAAARARSAGKLPVWLDVPILFFKPEHAGFWENLEGLCDGVTLMDYFDRTDTVLKFAAQVLGQCQKPVEIGIGLKTKPVQPVPGEEPAAPLKKLMDQIKTQGAASPNYAGLAIHSEKDFPNYFK